MNSLLFILTAEILSHKRWLHANITGINIGQLCGNTVIPVIEL